MYPYKLKNQNGPDTSKKSNKAWYRSVLNVT